MEMLSQSRLPSIERGALELANKRIVTAKEFYRLARNAQHSGLFTISGKTKKAIEKVQDAIIELTEDRGLSLRGFSAKVDGVFDKSNLGQAHMELVYRNTVQSMFSDGIDETHELDVVKRTFPYVRYVAIHDVRARETHLALEKLGIQGTDIYRADDPVIKLFRPPWEWNCRCGRIFLTTKQAANSGIREAEECLKRGVHPFDIDNPAYVKMPPFRPPPGWNTGKRTAGRLRQQVAGAWSDT